MGRQRREGCEGERIGPDSAPSPTTNNRPTAQLIVTLVADGHERGGRATEPPGPTAAVSDVRPVVPAPPTLPTTAARCNDSASDNNNNNDDDNTSLQARRHYRSVTRATQQQ